MTKPIARAKVRFVIELLRRVRCDNFTVPDQRYSGIRLRPKP